MRGTDWLRRKAAAAIRISDARPAAGETIYVNLPVELEPGHLHVLPIATSADEPQQLPEQQRAKAAADRADYPQQRGWLDCPCAVIYSRCCYPSTHLQQPS